MNWLVRGHLLAMEKTLLMGVLNVTPDSFSDGGRYLDPGSAAAHALRLMEEGADLLDLGAESTRPGADPVSTEEELERLLPVLDRLVGHVPIPISIDTTKFEVARACLERGAHIINDVSGLKESGRSMAEVVRGFQAGLILMHRRGSPRTMQTLCQYKDVAGEVIEELSQSVEAALEAGLRREAIAVDPGLGFAKTAEQNLELLRELERFHVFERPLVLGPSRKSFVGAVTGRGVEERLFGTGAVAALAVAKGVHILRVHDVAAMRDVVKVAEAIEGAPHVGTF